MNFVNKTGEKRRDGWYFFFGDMHGYMQEKCKKIGKTGELLVNTFFFVNLQAFYVRVTKNRRRGNLRIR